MLPFSWEHTLPGEGKRLNGCSHTSGRRAETLVWNVWRGLFCLWSYRLGFVEAEVVFHALSKRGFKTVVQRLYPLAFM